MSSEPATAAASDAVPDATTAIAAPEATAPATTESDQPNTEHEDQPDEGDGNYASGDEEDTDDSDDDVFYDAPALREDGSVGSVSRRTLTTTTSVGTEASASPVISTAPESTLPDPVEPVAAVPPAATTPTATSGTGGGGAPNSAILSTPSTTMVAVSPAHLAATPVDGGEVSMAIGADAGHDVGEAPAEPVSEAIYIKDAATGRMYRLDEVEHDYATFDAFLGMSCAQGAESDSDGDGGKSAATGPEPALTPGDDEASSDKTSESKKSSGGGGGGFMSMFKRKPKVSKEVDDGTIKVHTRQKNLKEFTKLVQCQTLKEHSGPVWTMKWSVDGQYLASAGQDTTVLVWRVAAFGTPRTSPDGKEDDATAASSSDREPLLDPVPVRRYSGHTNHIVDLAWSNSHFLLSASMDLYVRLWHVSRDECLHKFQHPDCVTAVSFHPTEDTYFLTGCFDKRLRIWNRRSGRVVMWQPTAVMVTAAAFSPNGRMVVAGLFSGQCVFYNVQANGFGYHTQIECRNRQGRMRKGRKVTGVEFTDNGASLLVTTNDSRCRMFSLDDFSMTYKYIGLVNNNMQIRASCDPSGDHVICGSEDKSIYVWRTRNDHYVPSINPRLTGFRRHKNRSVEFFEAHDSVVTVAMFAPEPVKALLRPPVPTGAAHMLIVSAGMMGDIRVFENIGMPVKL